jgi:ABC-type glutathione transport system ATPase component
MTALLTAEGLVRRYGDVRAVNEASLHIARGECVGLVGPSGGGKSTLAALLARLIDADAGRILLDGTDLAAVPARRAAQAPWRARVQMTFQDAGAALDPRARLADAVAVPLARLRGLRGATLRAAAAAALDAVGLDASLAGRRPHQLSGGQLARAGIARAIAPGPDLLILDEPTAALDVSAQASVLHHLAALRRERGMAMLLISHDTAVVRILCDRVLTMRAGRIAA